MSDLVIFTSNEVGVNCISSLSMVKLFDREHFHITRDIEELIEDGTLMHPNFGCISYQDTLNRTQKMYLLTEAGFIAVVGAMNLKQEGHKKLRKEILSKFAKFQAKETARLLQLEASHKKKERTHGYIVKHGDFIDIQLYERVLRADHSERELAAGEIVYNNWIIQGLVNKNVKLAKAIEEID